jgi:hypothetical protein
MLTTNIFTPDEDSKTEAYFMKNMPTFMTFLALFIFSHYLYEFDENLSILITRSIAAIIVFLSGILRKKWIFYIVCAIWIVSQFFKSGMIST